MNDNFDWKKYVIVLFITAGLFLTASFISNYFGDQKINKLKNIQNNIAIDILSSETQFSLLSELSCKNISDAVFSGELQEFGSKLEWSQNNLGATEEVSYLKKYYALLQIKDYLLSKKISERCGVKSAFILYFYTTAENCALCEKQSLVLTELRNKYNKLRVYSFDYSTELSAVSSMLQIYKIKDTELPALVLDDEVLTGFHEVQELEKKVKKSFKLQEIKPQNKSSEITVEKI
jgi:thiol-disulfide isomerase/thioredoxin